MTNCPLAAARQEVRFYQMVFKLLIPATARKIVFENAVKLYKFE